MGSKKMILSRLHIKFSILLRNFLFLTLSVCFASGAHAQENDDPETRVLLDKYLHTTDSAEAKINELLGLAFRNGPNEDIAGQIKKMQIALILEKYIPNACKATFDLNVYMGEIFTEINFPYAIHYYEKAISIGLQSKERTDKYTVYNILAGLYLKLNDHSNVLRSYRNAMNEADGNVGVSSVNNNIGWFYARIGKNDSAMAYFKNALSYYDKSTTDDDLYSSILENIAKQEELKGNYNAALKIYRFNEGFYLRHNALSNFVGNKVNMIRMDALLNMPGIKASVDSLSKIIDNNIHAVNQNDALRLYKFSYDYFIAKEVNTTANLYNNKYNNLKDLIGKKDLKKANALTNALLNVQSLSFKNEYQAYRVELQAAKMSYYKNKVIAILFLVTALLIIVTLTIFIKKRKKELEITRRVSGAELKAKELEAKAIKSELENARLQSEAEIQKKEIEKQLIENEFERERFLAKAELKTRDLERTSMLNELELKKKDLTNTILLNTHVYEANKEIISQLQKISGEGDPLKSLKSLLLDLISRNQIAERVSSLQKNIDHLNTEFYHKLQLKFPQLSKTEVHLCGYILINLSNKDIAILKNIEPASVKMSKTRLRKKLSLSPDDDILNFIRTI